MSKITEQMKVWSDDFGKEYTDRNSLTPQEMDELYTQRIGVSRTTINQRFLGSMNRSLRILEVGANIGTQLLILQNQGFTDLWGVEVQWYAVEQAKKRTHNINILQGSAFDLPFKDNFFDLVFTSGVLIHIKPDDLPQVMQEIYRCSKTYIWGFEYWSASCVEVPYRGNTNLLWKNDFASQYRKLFVDLRLIKEEQYPWLHDENLVDAMFLLNKERG